MNFELEISKVYKYKDEVYRKEELEQMGFVCLTLEDINKIKDSKDNYVVKIISDELDINSSLDKELFFIDKGDIGYILDVEELVCIKFGSSYYITDSSVNGIYTLVKSTIKEGLRVLEDKDKDYVKALNKSIKANIDINK